MALEGNLTAFGLSEILQLIAVQQKTGMLTVTSENRLVVMFFRDGRIISTRDRRRRVKDPFKEYLTRYGVLTRDDLIRLSQISSRSKLDLVEIIASEGFMSVDELETHYRNQVQETMFEVLSWEQCSYKFVNEGSAVMGVKSPTEFNVEAMLMESMRRKDEMPQLTEMFPNDAMLVTRASESDTEDEEITSNERAVLDMLTQTVRIRDIIARAKIPRFEVYESLKLLMEKDLIEVEEEETEEVAERTSEPRAKKRRSPLAFVPVMGALLLFVGSVALGFRPVTEFLVSPAPSLSAGLQSKETSRRQVEARLRWALSGYRAKHGQYPASLEELSESGLAGSDLIESSKRHEFTYRLTRGRGAYTLL